MSQDTEALAPQHAVRVRPVWIRWVLGIALLLSVLVTGAGWVIASPIGSSPDDDYHLDSIWCPHPVEDSCPTRVVDGVTEIEVPRPIGDNSPCYAFKSEDSAACSIKFSDDDTRWAIRYDAGAYPPGYYRFHHLLIGPNARIAALAMRTANVLIAVALLGTIGVLMPKRLRQHYAFALLASLIPMGIYFIASNNPSSWSITGIIATAAGMYSSIHSRGIRRWALFACAIIGAILSYSSRFDTALYVFVVAAALLFAVKWDRSLTIHAITTALLGTIGLAEILLSGRSGAVDAAAASANQPTGFAEKVIRTLMALPELFGGFYGFIKGPGWFDVPLDGPITAMLLVSAGGALFVGLRPGSWRKWMAALMVFGAMCGLPIVMVVRGLFDNFSTYQPRYLLPLLPVLFFFLFALDAPKRRLFTTPQLVLFSASIVIAHSLTLHKVLTRYTRGLVGPEKLNLNYGITWWWDIPVSPMLVWIGASLAMLLVFICVIALTHQGASNDQGHDSPSRHQMLEGSRDDEPG